MTRAFKCDSCGELYEGESPAVARLDVRAGDDFGVPDHLREDNRSVSDRVRELAGDDRGQDLFMELCLGCARDLIPEPEPVGEGDAGDAGADTDTETDAGASADTESV